GGSVGFGNWCGVGNWSSIGFDNWRSVGDWSSVGFGNWSGVRNWSSGEFGNWGGVGYWSWGGYGFHSDGSWFFTNHCVESVNWISGVVDSSFGPVSINEGVATLDDVSIAGFLLALGVTGQAVVDVIGVAVLRVGIVVGINGLGYHCLCYWSDYCLGYGGCYC
ncbi:hypothetical protein WN48_11116, partial [Eufriesea mexicana]